MHRFFWTACLSCLAATAFGQAAPKPKAAPQDPALLMEALNHRSPAIRLRAAQLLIEASVDATPRLVDVVLRADDLPAVRAAVVLIDRLTRPTRVGATVASPQPKLTPEDIRQIRRLTSIVKNSAGVEPWRFYLAVHLIDKLDPASLAELLTDLRAALRPGEAPMKQYAAVQAIFRLGPDGHAAEGELWTLLQSRPCFRGLYVARRALDDDAVAFTDEIGIYNLLLGLENSYVIADLFVLDTLRRVGASSDRLTEALAHLAWHESQDVRLDVARQLGRLDNDRARQIAAGVLNRLVYEPGSVLLTLLADEKPDDTILLFTQLGPVAVSTVPTLAGLLSARENRVRLNAAVTLGRIGPPAAAALPALREALRFEQLREGDDAKAMVDAINVITGKGPDQPKAGAKQ